MTAIAVADLTQVAIEGTGVFDVLMRATKTHLELEFKAGRIKGAEYATVYLGSVEQVMQTSLAFLLAKEKTSLEALLMTEQIALVHQQRLNAEVEMTVLQGQKCKLDAEYDLTLANKLRVDAEASLLTQKITTERAQTSSTGVDADSVVGKQKALYTAQTNGFTRDAEQKAAKLMSDTWNVRRTTDDATVADATNMLNDAAVGRAITKMLNGVGA